MCRLLVFLKTTVAGEALIFALNTTRMIREIWDGLSSYLRAIVVISRLRLWSYVLIPGLLSIVLGAVVIAAAWSLSDDIGGTLTRLWPWEWGAQVVDSIGQVLGGLVLLIGGLLVFKHLILILSGPFMSPLSEKIERHLAGYDEPMHFSPTEMLQQFGRSVVLGGRNAVLEILLTIPLLILGLVPVFAPLATVLIFLVQSYYAGFGNMDFTLERHFMVCDSIRFVRRHRGVAIANGAVYLLLLLTGLGFLIALPLAVVAATIETVKRLETTVE